jgi:CheY-like chemotaxis protein
MRNSHNQNSQPANSYALSQPADLATNAAHGQNGHNGHNGNGSYAKAKLVDEAAGVHAPNGHSSNGHSPYSSAKTAEADAAHREAMAANAAQRAAERRRRSRVKVSAPVRVRPVNSTGESASEVTSTCDVSRTGIRFVTATGSYNRGDKVAIVFPYSAVPGEVHAEQMAHVVRTVECPDGSTQVAITFETHELSDETLNSSDSGAARNENSVRPSLALESVPQKEYVSAGVLVVEPDERARQTICSYLVAEGYKVVGVGGHASAREILNTHVPAVVIAEIEGEGRPGLDLCAHIKSERRLNRVPVILITRSAYPSDYANAHRAGALICMAKPFKQEKLGHMVRLVAPLKLDDKNAPAKKVNGRVVLNAASSKPTPKVVASKSATVAPAKKPVVMQPAPKANINPTELKPRTSFKDLCNEAIVEKDMRESGRYDMNAVPEASSKDSKRDSRSGLSSLKSLFKR